MPDSRPRTVRDLRGIDDVAAGHGFSEYREARLAGGGHARLDGETIELRPFDALRVAPEVARSFAAVRTASSCWRSEPRIRATPS